MPSASHAEGPGSNSGEGDQNDYANRSFFDLCLFKFYRGVGCENDWGNDIAVGWQ